MSTGSARQAKRKRLKAKALRVDRAELLSLGRCRTTLGHKLGLVEQDDGVVREVGMHALCKVTTKEHKQPKCAKWLGKIYWRLDADDVSRKVYYKDGYTETGAAFPQPEARAAGSGKVKVKGSSSGHKIPFKHTRHSDVRKLLRSIA